MTSIDVLHGLGQSIWYDNIQRRLLENGELAGMIQRGEIRGVTSNPSIFNNAIAKTNDYDPALKPMAWAGWKSSDMFWQLAIEDIRDAADLFLPLYRDSAGGDGYVSLEVDPNLANKTKPTVKMARQLWQRVDRPNLMIKIPATKEGIPAVREAIAAGLNVNVTLIFSLERYADVIEAYMSGLEDRVKARKPVDGIASVASFFISRVDTKVDALLEGMVKAGKLDAEKAKKLSGKAAIANARLAYALFEEKFNSERFNKLKAKGAKVQRPLWASTSTKNPAYRDVIYVEELIGPDTVNTVPPQTLVAMLDHGKSARTVDHDVEGCKKDLAALEALGISMAKVTDELEVEGVKAFADAFSGMMKSIEDRRKAAVRELAGLAKPLAARVSALDEAQAVKRMFDIDPTFWTDDAAGQEEIRKRLGWLTAPAAADALIPGLKGLAEELSAEGFTHALLLGMGGSSLAPEVMRLTLGTGPRGLDLAILDSTDAVQVRDAFKRAPVAKTLFIVSSKSGSTAEVQAFIDYAWGAATKKLGKKAGSHFIAVTDPNTSLEALAKEKGFRKIYNADPMVGGRYSALIAFGLVPMAVMDLDLEKLGGRAKWMMNQCVPSVPAGRNPGLVLGALMGEAALQGRDKLTILTDPELQSIGSWLEQLIAESSGKLGKGIIPVDIEPAMGPKSYGADRIFVYLRLNGSRDVDVQKLQRTKQPVVVLPLASTSDLTAEFYRWEIATAVACAVLSVNAFDQPDVQFNKKITQEKIAAYRKENKLNEGEPVWKGKDALVYGKRIAGMEKAESIQAVVELLLQQVKPGDYVAINAYLPRNDKTLKELQKLRKKILKRTGCATTLGFGPRFLHSTGQLHKGGANNGVFLQLTADPSVDYDIPGEGLTFEVLERAQAMGDLDALIARERRVLRVHLTGARPGDLVK